jgi:hypothetical protein
MPQTVDYRPAAARQLLGLALIQPTSTPKITRTIDGLAGLEDT